MEGWGGAEGEGMCAGEAMCARCAHPKGPGAALWRLRAHPCNGALYHRHLLLQGLEDGAEGVDERLDFLQGHGALSGLLHNLG